MSDNQVSVDEWLDEPQEDGDTEAASENPAKRRGGRPRVTPLWWEYIAHSPVLAGKTRKTVVKRFHAQRAIDALGKTADQDFPYLLGKKFTRSEILTELGRLKDDEAIREAATAICEHKVKSKDAVTLIRRWRIGKTGPGDTDALAKKFASVIRDYKLRRPDMTSEQVGSALTQRDSLRGANEADAGANVFSYMRERESLL